VNVTAGPGDPEALGPKLSLAIPVCGRQPAGRDQGSAGPRSARMGCRGQPMALGHRLEAGERLEDHLDGCLECRAALTTCLREGCQSAENAFRPIVDRAAVGALRALRVNPHIPGGEDMLSESMEKGWDLLLRGRRCAPQMVLTGDQASLGAYLFCCMLHKLISLYRKERPEFPLDELDQVPASGPLVDDGVVDADQEKVLLSIITDYHRELAEQGPAVRARLFEVWLEDQLRAAGSQKARTQDEVAELVYVTGQRPHQTTISRQFRQFREELLARIVAAPEIDDQTRRLAQQLFAESRRPRRNRTTSGDGGTRNV
jgi:hypothetical protein